MRFSLQLPTDRVQEGAEFTGARAIVEMAQAVERAGFDACYVTEHPFPPDQWLETGGHHALDPFASLTAAAVATERLRLHTNILVLAYRNPFLTAKSVASLDVISGGRVIVGIAAGYLEAEYAALGADFANRNTLTDAALGAMKRAWTGESVTIEGHGDRATGHTMLPRPVQKPHPPIWVGGNSERAMRRAVEHAQGWSPFPVAASYSDRARTAPVETVDDLARGIEKLRALAQEASRDEPLDVNFVPFGLGMNPRNDPDPAAFVDQVHALESVGVTWLSIGLPCRSRASFCESVDRFGAEVIATLAR